MKNLLYFFCFVIALTACRGKNKDAAAIGNFDNEINNRLSILKGLSPYDDSLAYYSSHIHEEVSKLILLSKDVENISACVSRSNVFFEKMGERFGASEKAFTALHAGMPPASMELMLKGNELFLLNQIIFNNSGADVRMFSATDAQEE